MGRGWGLGPTHGMVPIDGQACRLAANSYVG